MANTGIQEEFREALDEDIFDEIGKTVSLIVNGNPVYNERGELEGSTQTTVEITAVPYNIVNDRQSHQQFGEMEEGDMDMVVRYDQDIVIDNYVVVDSDTYKVKSVAKNYLPDNVATIVRITQTEPLESDD